MISVLPGSIFSRFTEHTHMDNSSFVALVIGKGDPIPAFSPFDAATHDDNISTVS